MLQQMSGWRVVSMIRKSRRGIRYWDNGNRVFRPGCMHLLMVTAARTGLGHGELASLR